MSIVENVGGVPYETKVVTFLASAWKRLVELGCTVTNGGKLASQAFIRIPEGKEIELSTDPTLTAGKGVHFNNRMVCHLESSQEISNIYFRAIDNNVEGTVVLETAQSDN